MTHQQHVDLIRKAITETGGVWADLGSGEGAFTLALRDIAGENIEIYSVDMDEKRLKKQKEVFATQFPHTHIHFIQQDFTKNLNVPPLDGILMANSLHYVEDHISFLQSLQNYLKPHCKLVLVEYSLDDGKPPWVPYPLSFTTFEKEAQQAGFSNITLLKKIPSSYWGEMYSAVAEK